MDRTNCSKPEMISGNKREMEVEVHVLQTLPHPEMSWQLLKVAKK